MRSDADALVSVIVPTFNAEDTLDQCLTSVLAQTHPELEVLCVNDGSTDGSLDVMRAHAARDPRVVIVDKPNGGYGQGCNVGIARARGAWVSIVEPDDWIEPCMYEHLLALAARFDEPIDVVKASWTDVVDWDDPATQSAHPSVLTHRLRTSRAPFTIAEHTALMEWHPSIWSAIYRRDFLLERGIRFVEYPGAGWADNPFLVETLCQAERILYLDECLYDYRADLEGSTLDHPTDELVARPFDRWDTMMDVIERLGITDERILRAHYVRGFNYSFGAIYDDGWDNPIVRRRTREVFSRMDPAIALTCVVAPHRKRFFCSVMGLPEPKLSPWPWRRHLVSETWLTLRLEGPVRVLERMDRALNPEEPDHA